ncbi:isopenicillin N synthase [Mycolicibacterium canariasense]|uniref:Isopenicillin N synthase n=1 Tax=Mycolicibacterium canariasense TaxID=228230 RepID=A0A100WGR7_MYCCR|nr:2-oxoglutarate and iron-dependent oxygenase domain-containing protein [Mycolicibacterium canariasense]MCV7209571.1 isopenicillin N synthase family oxygenase [Mycolicibacterium canariasense]ORU99504.1 2OG-Fe(II) oxygenase [Mycolicibacterium canariasense]GAS97583.1 isopenicillin N synthase [Mycolicibacterium canariasense]
MFDVPVLDISCYTAGGSAAGDPACARVAAAFDTACREVGFVQVVGHGIDAEAIADLAAALDEFFGLPLTAKVPHRRDPSTNRGYSPPKSESLSMSLGIATNPTNDYYEAYTVGVPASAFGPLQVPESSYAANNWPDAAPGFRPRVERYFAEAQRLARTLMTVVTDALALPPRYFDPMIDHSIEVLKMNNFALPEGEPAEDLQGMGAHTDFGILTVLWADQVPGLQVLDRDGGWHDVQPADGALLINLGDAMARWTNDRWLSTVHRVDPPVVDGRIQRRRSAAFFFDGNYDAVLEALPGTLADGEVGYQPITVAENIAMKVAGLRTGAAPQTQLREAARVSAAANQEART